MRPAIRLAALMKLHVVYVFTHDSVGVGEDGPTHQPIEHAGRAARDPESDVIRPADAGETAAAWRVAMHAARARRAGAHPAGAPRARPATLRSRAAATCSPTRHGRPDVILIATGSEVACGPGRARRARGRGVKARVVSLPSWELFDEQPQAYRDSVLPPDLLARVAVEAGIPQGWQKYVGSFGAVVGIENRFGASAPAKVVFEKLGFTPASVAAKAVEVARGLARAAGHHGPAPHELASVRPREVDEAAFDVGVDELDAHPVADVEALAAAHDPSLDRGLEDAAPRFPSARRR